MKKNIKYLLLTNLFLTISLLVWNVVTVISLGISLKYEVDEATTTTFLLNVNDRKNELNGMINFGLLNSIYLVFSLISLGYLFFYSESSKNK